MSTVRGVEGPALTIGRTTYQVRLVTEPTKDDETRAFLIGPRGATYALLPNVNNPTLCFPVAERVGRSLGGALENMWFRLIEDETGRPTGVKLA